MFILVFWVRLLGLFLLGGRGVDVIFLLFIDMIFMLSLILVVLKLFFMVSIELLRLLLFDGRLLFYWVIRFLDRFIFGNIGIWEFFELFRFVFVILVNILLLWIFLFFLFWLLILVFFWEINFYVLVEIEVGFDLIFEEKK